MANLIPTHHSRRQVARLEREVHRALELAQANAAIQAGRQAARVRAVGRVARVAMDELALVNEAEALYGYGAGEHAQMRLRLVADGAALTMRSITMETSWR